MTDFGGLLKLLADGEVEFILIGGLAAGAHGSAHLTQDVDVAYRRTPENVERLAKALAAVKPYLRGAPAGLPFTFDAATIRRGLNFTLTTSLGDLDVLGEVTGGGPWEALKASSVELEVFGAKVWCLDLPALIVTKRAAGRPKDLQVVAELETLLAERER